MSLLRELPRYRCTHTPGALKIATTIPNPRGVELHFEDTRFAPIQVDAAWYDAHKVEVGGYFMAYGNGVVGYMPRIAFEQTYLPCPGGEA